MRARAPTVPTLEDLDESALKKILTEPKNASVKQYQRLFEMESVDLTLAEEALSAISKKAIERKTGARGLRSIMESILLDTMFDLPGLEGVKEVGDLEASRRGHRPTALHLRRPPRSYRRRRRERLSWVAADVTQEHPGRVSRLPTCTAAARLRVPFPALGRGRASIGQGQRGATNDNKDFGP